ncbi:hypothetical protein TOT_030000882 [Theileria orientalis strain Shintoku]|uniref:Uncharacterized protein n=1 Tax=Theileria orientalis strain Shintoku TaxID=869250 RepID=J4C8Y9_THEOR|nr:hypothetical protein TOT_030000882 [Theileria orientalis strain Shintoku]BAM41618.1 hypothetical protein TOT_030000882 [Theileria orientalis strain Shintoku]|eukprot:XP_009691919.1 hypothetical protein TOT_030000882 [Theileria orientalis strain Shintoku]
MFNILLVDFIPCKCSSLSFEYPVLNVILVANFTGF